MIQLSELTSYSMVVMTHQLCRSDIKHDKNDNCVMELNIFDNEISTPIYVIYGMSK